MAEDREYQRRQKRIDHDCQEERRILPSIFDDEDEGPESLPLGEGEMMGQTAITAIKRTL